MKKLNILFIASESSPVVKVGGLADVVGSLPTALKKIGCNVRIILPFYQVIDAKKYRPRLFKKKISIVAGGRTEHVDLYQIRDGNGTVIYLIYNKKYLSLGQVYSSKKHMVGAFWEKERFLFFTESVVLSLPHLRFNTDILHLHDWHTGMVPKFLSCSLLKNPRYCSIKTLFTIHNIANQGRWNKKDVIPFLDMSESDFDKEDFSGNDVNPMRFGILHSDIINTVSPTYAKEITTPAYGEGLENALKKRKKKLFGILNGIDTEAFNPQTDRRLRVPYSRDTIDLKTLNKTALQKELSLRVDERIPLLGIVSRLVYQKGIDWLIRISPQLLRRNVQLVVLGTGDPSLEEQLKKISRTHPNMRAMIQFDTALAQKIYAASDMLLIPSRFEPCGLTQMIAMRYGTIPVARATGGLKDTIRPYHALNRSIRGTGFLFTQKKPSALYSAIAKALKVYNNKINWRLLQQSAMKQDFSWNKSAKAYMRLYMKLANKK